MSNFIVFPETASWEVARGCVSFPAEVDGRRIKCLVPNETLRKFMHSCDEPGDPVAAFRAVQAQAREVARRLLLKGRGMATGQLIIKPEDCPAN